MENGPFIDDFPIKTSIYKGFFHIYILLLVGGAITILKNMSSSMGRMTTIYEMEKKMFETTNLYIFIVDNSL